MPPLHSFSVRFACAFLALVPLCDAASLSTLPGFKVEELLRTDKNQGSWVSVCVDAKGDLIASDQYGFLWRVTPPPIGTETGAKVEQVKIDGGKAHGLLWAFDSLYFLGGLIDPKNPKSRDNDKRSLWRARDADGDGQFEDVKKLVDIESGGEHGPHALVLSPDGKQIYFACGNLTGKKEFQKSIVPRVWQEDQLLPRMFDPRGHARGTLSPGGTIARMNPDGTGVELVSIGYRNQYDFAFDQNGECFTYDSDMEWDLGLPWYRPTRICHATSGSEFGWRSGSGVWPNYYPDNLPSVVDIGPGSPTGLVFGTGAKFPAKYQKALYAMDWSFGTLYALHLTPDGSTWKAEKEIFLSGESLPLADMVVRPQDGALYVVTGGRRTQSALSRITYTGADPVAPVKADKLTDLQQLRRNLEAQHKPDNAEALKVAWPHLDHPDRFIRFAARTAIELQPVASWQSQVAAEKRPRAARQAVLALARCSTDKSLSPKLIEQLLSQDWAALNEADKLEWLRVTSIVLIRLGDPSPETAKSLLAKFDPLFPTGANFVDRELSNMLIHLKSPTIVAKAVGQMEKATDTQEETFSDAHLARGGRYGKTIAEMQKQTSHKQQVHYAFHLRNATAGWSKELYDRYFNWHREASEWKGGNSFTGYLVNARDELLLTIKDEVEKRRYLALASRNTANLKNIPQAKGPGANYTVADFAGVTIDSLKKRDRARGKEMYQAALCASCHKFGADGGGGGGPDLTGAAARYTVSDLLTAIIEPNKEVSDQYAFTEFTLKDGTTISGRVARDDERELQLITSFLAPETFTGLGKNKIKSQQLSKVSPMLPGLINGLNRDEVLDMLGYVMSGGN